MMKYNKRLRRPFGKHDVKCDGHGPKGHQTRVIRWGHFGLHIMTAYSLRGGQRQHKRKRWVMKGNRQTDDLHMDGIRTRPRVPTVRSTTFFFLPPVCFELEMGRTITASPLRRGGVTPRLGTVGLKCNANKPISSSRLHPSQRRQNMKSPYLNGGRKEKKNRVMTLLTNQQTPHRMGQFCCWLDGAAVVARAGTDPILSSPLCIVLCPVRIVSLTQQRFRAFQSQRECSLSITGTWWQLLDGSREFRSGMKSHACDHCRPNGDSAKVEAMHSAR